MSIEEETSSIIHFLTKSFPGTFVKGDGFFDLEVNDPREAFLLASTVKDSFMLKRRNSHFEQYHVDLPYGFASMWFRDYLRGDHQRFKGKLYVKFFGHWVPTRGYEGHGAQYRLYSRLQEMYANLSKMLNNAGKGENEVLFIPYYYYSDETGYQFGESLYHYLIGVVLREMGYLVINEYMPHLFTSKMPDLSAIKTPTINDALNLFRDIRLIGSGALLQELQCHQFGEVEQRNVTAQTDAEIIAVEIERSRTRYTIKAGSQQLSIYLSEAYGFYDEGYLAGPFIEGSATISFDYDGTPTFSRDSRKRSQVSDHLQTLRLAQIRDVETIMKIELLKNLDLRTIIELCGKDAETYHDLYLSCTNLTIDSIIHRLD